MRRLLLATTALAPLGFAAAGANPLGGSVVGGSASISGTGTPSVTINQSSQNAVINWNSFNIGAGEHTRFNQPNASSSVLNRVLGDPNPSQIHGMLSANGRVFLINPNGILIGNGAVINTASFLATTHDIKNADFMAGRYHFNIPGRPDASIVNLGTITASNAGFAALVAPGVRNSGTITANFGKIGLASANGFSLDLYGDRLIQLDVNDQIAGSVRDVATGETLRSLVQNEGTLRANGGRVELTAVAARQVVDSVINTSGVIEARSIGRHAGRIVLGAATGRSKPAGAPKQTVKVSGKLTVASKKAKGGKIEITGENIELANARLDASGATGGGTVLIGGDIGGGMGNPLVTASLEGYLIPNATTVSINGGTVIDASATVAGDGGKVVVWSDQSTSFGGMISARGGEISGNGGFVEVSGKNTLGYSGRVDLSAPHGSFGTLLLDPLNFTVGTQDGANSISVATLLAQLGLSNVLITSTDSADAEPGDIIVASSIGWKENTTLTLSAFHDVLFIDGVTIANAGAGNLVLRADNTGTGSGTVGFAQGTVGSAIDWSGSTGTVSIYYNPADGFAAPTDFSPFVAINAAVSSQLTAYMLVNDATNLQDMQASAITLAGTYALGRDIDATGFVPGGPGTTFTGIFDGSGGLGANNTISNLSLGPGQNPVGLFGFVGPTGIVRNLNLANVDLTAASSLLFMGALAGENNGFIDNVHVLSGAIGGGRFSSIGAGGLVGQNSGTITNSSAAVNVTLGDAVLPFGINIAGGLVGSNLGTILGSSASGAVHVGSGGVGGGLVGYNSGSLLVTLATGAVTGAAGIADIGDPFGLATVLGGLVGRNQGTIGLSFATGNVGSPGVDRLLAGGFVGDNSGFITLASASGDVNAGNFSQAGGFAGANSINDCVDCFGPGIAFNNSATIVSSSASGDVTVGSSSLAGGFVGVGSTIVDGHASGAVTGGANSILGGFAGIHEFEGAIELSSASGPVTSTGPNSWVGGFVGWNIGLIRNSTASGNVTGTSDSLLGGFFGINFGLIVPSFAFGNVLGTGGNNFIGGFGGVNFGTLDTVTASGTVAGQGSNNVIGGVVGANAEYINFLLGTIPFSSFPGGTIVNSTGSPGIAPVGVDHPSTLPGYASIIDNCGNAACAIVQTGILGAPANPGDSTVPVPNSVLVPANFSNPPPPQDNSAALQILVELQSGGGNFFGGTGGTAGSTGSVGGASGSGPESYPNSTPGQPGFTPPPWPQRLTSEGMVPSGMPPPGETRFRDGQLVLRLSGDSLSPELLQFLQQLGITVGAIQSLTSLGGTLVTLELPSGLSIREAIARLESNQIVPQIAPDYVYGLAQPEGNGKGDPAQYILNKFQLEKTHRTATGKGITVAVIDSEVDKRHTELQGAISNEFDTLSVKEPPHFHGTAMAGAIVSRDRLMGVAPAARIIAVRAFGEANNNSEGTTLSVIMGVAWAVGQGAKVINMSFAGPRDPMLERAIRTAREQGVILVAAAGNAGPKSPPLYPGADPNVIAVTATDVRDRGFRGANQGPQLSVAAPGVEILAPAPEENYQMSTGTSIATAHVSGVVALMLERDPKLTPNDVRRILEETATDLGPRGKDAQYGWGLVNPEKALQAVEKRFKSSDASRARR